MPGDPNEMPGWREIEITPHRMIVANYPRSCKFDACSDKCVAKILRSEADALTEDRS